MNTTKKQHPHNPNYIHHQKERNSSTLRELVFGMEDGMVSTLGSVTGIAAATGDPFTTILAGLVIVSVESISMGVGSYLSSKSVRSIDERKLMEEKEELEQYPKEEEVELVGMYVKSGWSPALAKKMAKEAAQNEDLFLEEMAFRELKIIPDNLETPLENGIVMGVSYIFGGAIPLLPYFFLSTGSAIALSVFVTLIALFLLGVYITKYSKRKWFVSGFEMFALASAAALVGFVVGQIVDRAFVGR